MGPKIINTTSPAVRAASCSPWCAERKKKVAPEISGTADNGPNFVVKEKAIAGGRLLARRNYIGGAPKIKYHDVKEGVNNKSNLISSD